MSVYEALRLSFLPPSQAALSRARVFRQSRLVSALFFAVMASLLAGGVALRFAVPFEPAGVVLWYVMMPFLLLMAAIAGWAFRAAMGPDNWLVAVTGDALLVKFRSYLNRHFPPGDPVVARVPFAAIAFAQGVRMTLTVPGTKPGARETQFLRFLDLRLKDDAEAARLRAAIEAERAVVPPSGKLGRTRGVHYPVQVLADGTVRLTWRGPHDAVRPGLAAVLAALKGRCAVMPEAPPADVDLFALDRRAQEDRILEMALRGDRMGAVRAARRFYGLDLAAARQFVSELSGR
jgi:hypothetical protein